MMVFMSHKEVVELKGKACIYYSNKGLVLRYSTGILWHDRIIPQNEKVIISLVDKLHTILSDYRVDHDGKNPSRDFVRAMMKGEVVPKDCLMDYYREFLEFKSSEIIKGNLQPTSLIDYKTLRTILLDYEKLNKTKLQPSHLAEDFFIRFKEYLLTTRNLNNNTAHKRMKILKSFLNYCEEKKYFKLGFNISTFKMKGYDPTIVSLTEEEFCKLRDWDGGRFEKVKDLFIFGCLTSLKFSIIKNLRRDDIVDDQIIIRSGKPGIQRIIPLTPTSQSILQKYDYNLNFITNQTYNRLLKKMARSSDFFDTPVTVIIRRGDQRLSVQKPKWECFGSHLARRVNIIRNFSKNLPLDVVMDISGLKRKDTVLKYLNKEGSITEYSRVLE